MTTLDYQEAMDARSGKSVGFDALLTDVYRTKAGYKAVFGPFLMGFDAEIVVNVPEKDARTLAERARRSLFASYAVIAKFDALRVNYEPRRSVSGETGDDPDAMEVVEFGLEVHRVIRGDLVAFELKE